MSFSLSPDVFSPSWKKKITLIFRKLYRKGKKWKLQLKNPTNTLKTQWLTNTKSLHEEKAKRQSLLRSYGAPKSTKMLDLSQDRYRYCPFKYLIWVSGNHLLSVIRLPLFCQVFFIQHCGGYWSHENSLFYCYFLLIQTPPHPLSIHSLEYHQIVIKKQTEIGGKKLEMVCNVAAEMMMMNMMILIMLEQNKNNTSRKVQITKGTGTKICIQYFFIINGGSNEKRCNII